MVCYLCKNKFIRTKTQFGYMIQKEIMDKELENTPEIMRKLPISGETVEAFPFYDDIYQENISRNN